MSDVAAVEGSRMPAAQHRELQRTCVEGMEVIGLSFFTIWTKKLRPREMKRPIPRAQGCFV